jgi:alcohol dehydrogenase (cytochrome c)
MNANRIASALVLCALAVTVQAQTKDWPSYNRNLNSDRFATVSDIDTKNVSKLHVLCSFDTGEQTSFQTGPLQVDGALFGTTEHDTFSIDPNTCKLNWRTHEDAAGNELKVNRGVAWLEHRLFRGTSDGKVAAYDANTGKQLWATPIADPKQGESVPAAPIAWNGLVFIGNAGGDNKGVKGRMYALDAKDGHIVWQFAMAPEAKAAATASGGAGQTAPVTGGATWTSYSLDAKTGLLYVPVGNPAPDFVKEARPVEMQYVNSVLVLDAKTGTYQKHFQLVKHDFHDWDVSSAPTLFLNRTGGRMLAEAPKDGHLYLIDLMSGKTVFRKPVTQVLNAEAPLTKQGTRFCPGSQGGAEWNGAAFDAADNLLFTGEVSWCTTVKAVTTQALAQVPAGKAWSGATEGFGTQDDPKTWAGFLTATNADNGTRKWQFRAPAPILGGVTPTSGRLVFFGDMAGTLYALDAVSGEKLWSSNIGGAIGGGLITYDTGKGQRIAVAAGMNSPIWAGPKGTGKIVILSL